MDVAPADTIALLQNLDIGANILDNTHTLVAENNVCSFLDGMLTLGFVM
jgi:hypothetical protein